jgi:hypothetical protein
MLNRLMLFAISAFGRQSAKLSGRVTDSFRIRHANAQ